MLRVGVRGAAVALLALLAALVRGWAPLVPVSLAVLGGVYAGQLMVDDAALDGASPAFAAGVLVTAELAYWSLEERSGVKTEAGESLRRLVLVAALGLAALLVTAVLLVLVDAVRARGLAIDLVGAAAAAAALLTVVLAARNVTGRAH